jgi:hypothetical protein
MSVEMTMRQLLTFFEGYYGEKYSGVVLDAVVAYLDGRSADFYRAAADVLVKRYSRIYNKVPGPAEFEKNMDEIMATKPRQYYLPEPKREISDEERAEVEGMMDGYRQRVKAKWQECIYNNDDVCQNERSGITTCTGDCRHKKPRISQFGETLSKTLNALEEAV